MCISLLYVIVSFLLVLSFFCLSVHLCTLLPHLVNKDVSKNESDVLPVTQASLLKALSNTQCADENR